MKRKIGLLVFVVLVVSFTVPGCGPTTSKPTVMLAAPPHGAEFREGDNVAVQSASADAAGIMRIELLVDGALVRTDTAPGPQINFNAIQSWKATQGTHTISVRAFNGAGVASDAASVSITVSAGATPVAAAAPPTATAVVAAPSPVAIATPPPSPTSPAAPPAAACADNSELVIESVTEGTALAPAQPFEKGWRMKNSGTCAWGQGYAFVFISGEAMTSETFVPLSDPIAPGETADAWMEMTAPNTSGIHQGQWQLGNPGGRLFGTIFKVSINVVGGAPPPVGAAATATAQFQLLVPMQTFKTPTRLSIEGIIMPPTPTRLTIQGVIIPPTPTRLRIQRVIIPTRNPIPPGASDRNIKSNVVAVNPREVLARLAQIPVSIWNYTSDGPAIRHIGTMAQDFYAAFGVGETNTSIMQVDADGVAFAALQGLYQVVQEKDAQITALQKQNAAMEARVAALEQRSANQTIPALPMPLDALVPWLVVGAAIGFGFARIKR